MEYVILLSLFISFIFGADIRYRSELKGDFVTMSRDGNTIAVSQKVDGNWYCLIILKKTNYGFEQIKVTNANIYIPSNYSFLFGFAYQSNFKPKLTEDGSNIYFVDYMTRQPAKGDLTSLSLSSPVLRNIYIYGQNCTYNYECLFSLQQDNFLAIYDSNNYRVSLYSANTYLRSFSINDSFIMNSIIYPVISFEWDTKAKKVTFIKATSMTHFSYSDDTGAFVQQNFYTWNLQNLQYLQLAKFPKSLLQIRNDSIADPTSGQYLNYLKLTAGTSQGSFSRNIQSFISATLNGNLIGLAFVYQDTNYITLTSFTSFYNGKRLVDLRIIQSNNILSFDTDKKGTRVVYLNDASQIFVIDHVEGIQQTVNCQNFILFSKYCQYNLIRVLTYASFVISVVTFTYITVATILACCRFWKRKKRENSQKQKIKKNEGSSQAKIGNSLEFEDSRRKMNDEIIIQK